MAKKTSKTDADGLSTATGEAGDGASAADPTANTDADATGEIEPTAGASDANAATETTPEGAKAPDDGQAEPTTPEGQKAPTAYMVSVKADSRWPTIQAAGRQWSTTPVAVSVNDPALAELQNNDLLDVVAVEG